MGACFADRVLPWGVICISIPQLLTYQPHILFHKQHAFLNKLIDIIKNSYINKLAYIARINSDPVYRSFGKY